MVKKKIDNLKKLFCPSQYGNTWRMSTSSRSVTLPLWNGKNNKYMNIIFWQTCRTRSSKRPRAFNWQTWKSGRGRLLEWGEFSNIIANAPPPFHKSNSKDMAQTKKYRWLRGRISICIQLKWSITQKLTEISFLIDHTQWYLKVKNALKLQK